MSTRHGHPWGDLQADFQVLFVLLSNPDSSRTEVEAVIARIYPRLMALAAKILRSRHCQHVDCDPEVAVQEWFRNMLLFGLKGYDRSRPFYVYAYRALANICQSLVRRSTRRKSVSLDLEIEASPLLPCQRIEKTEQRKIVRHSVKRLPKVNRQALILKYWLGTSSAEAGRRLRKSRAQVDQLNHASRRLLASKETIQQLLDDFDSPQRMAR